MALISVKDHVPINGPENFGAAWISSLLFMQYRSPVSCIDILPALNYTDRLLPQSDGKHSSSSVKKCGRKALQNRYCGYISMTSEHLRKAEDEGQFVHCLDHRLMLVLLQGVPMDHLSELVQLLKNFKPELNGSDMTASFTELGMDSYDVVDFIMSVEKHFNIAVDDSQVMALESIIDVKNIIDQYNKED